MDKFGSITKLPVESGTRKSKFLTSSSSRLPRAEAAESVNVIAAAAHSWKSADSFTMLW